MAFVREVAAYVRGKGGNLSVEVDRARSMLVEQKSVADAPPYKPAFEEVYSAVRQDRKENGKWVPSPARVHREFTGKRKIKFDWHVGKRKPEAAAPAEK